MMHRRSVALSSKYDIYLVSNLTSMQYVAVNSHRKMLYYDINNIFKNAGFFSS